jgi:hypothetical protein
MEEESKTKTGRPESPEECLRVIHMFFALNCKGQPVRVRCNTGETGTLTMRDDVGKPITTQFTEGGYPKVINVAYVNEDGEARTRGFEPKHIAYALHNHEYKSRLYFANGDITDFSKENVRSGYRPSDAITLTFEDAELPDGDPLKGVTAEELRAAIQLLRDSSPN